MFKDCDWLTYKEIKEIKEKDEINTPTLYWDNYNDNDILYYYQMINPENEQKLIYSLATEEEKSQSDFERDFCTKTNSYYDFTSTYSTYMGKITDILNDYYWYGWDTISKPNKDDYNEIEDYDNMLSDYEIAVSKIEDLCNEYTRLKDEASLSAYFTDNFLPLTLETFVD